jgi:transcriptional regulator with XRE-family HTH domain
MAERGGVKPNTQVNYEGGRSAPDADYLGRLAALGLDVLYVVTGQRTPDKKGVVRVGQELSRREQALLEGYRATNDMGRRIIEGTTSLVSDEAPATKDGTRG